MKQIIAIFVKTGVVFSIVCLAFAPLFTSQLRTFAEDKFVQDYLYKPKKLFYTQIYFKDQSTRTIKN